MAVDLLDVGGVQAEQTEVADDVFDHPQFAALDEFLLGRAVGDREEHVVVDRQHERLGRDSAERCRQVATSAIGRRLYPKRFRHYTHGYYAVEGRHLYVNRGLSYGQRVLHWCRPEITLFKLTAAPNGANGNGAAAEETVEIKTNDPATSRI